MTLINQTIKRITLWYYTLYMVVCSAAGGLFFHLVKPQWAFDTYWLIPAMFYLWGVVTGVAFSFTERMMPKHTHHFYMMHKAVKFMWSLAVLLLMMYLGGENKKQFVLTFVVFYFLTMGFELWFFCHIEFIKKMNGNPNDKKEKE